VADETDFEPLRVFSFVFQPEVLIVWMIFGLLISLLLTISINWYMAILSFPAWFMTAMLLLNYGIEITDQTARGHQRMRRMAFPQDGRAFKLTILMVGLLSLVAGAPTEYRIVLLGLVLLITPAAVAFVALEGAMFAALNPIRLVSFIYSMGFSYVALRLLITFGLFLVLVFTSVHFYDTQIPAIIVKAQAGLIGVYLMLVICRSTGALLHARRHQLGLWTSYSPEQAEQAQAEITRKQQLVFLDGLNKECHAGEHRRAWERLETLLKRNRYADEAFFFSELDRWQDRVLLHKLTQGYLKRLIEQDAEIAWQIYLKVIRETDSEFTLDSGELALKLAESADNAERRRTSLDALQFFDKDFPRHPRSRYAFLLATSLAIELNEMERARKLFRIVQTRRGLISKVRYDECVRVLATGHAGH
jgi:hypothetical protein